MRKPLTCPDCNSVNKPDAVTCRVCGVRIVESRSTRQRKPPVILQRTMSGEVFSAVMGEVPKREGRSRIRIGAEKSLRREVPSEDAGHGIKDEDVTDLLREILKLLQSQRYDEAIATADRILLDRPREPKALIVKADALFRAGRHEEAARIFDNLIAHDSGNAKLWLDRARVQMAMRAFPEALQSYDRAIEIDDDLADAWYERSLVLAALGNVAEALKSVARALEVRDDHPRAAQRRAELEYRVSRETLHATAEQIEDQIAEIEREVGETTEHVKTGDVPEVRSPDEAGHVPSSAALPDVVESSPRPDPNAVQETQSPRLPTYVEGLDDALHGGVPEGSVVVVAGPPGTMKSSLCLSIVCWNAIRDHRRAVYLSFEGSEERLHGQARSLGLPIEDARSFVQVHDVHALQATLQAGNRDWIDNFLEFLDELRKQGEFSFLVLDSLEALEAIAGFRDRRRGLFRLFEQLRGLGTTTFVIAERPDIVVRGHVLYGRWVEDFLADGVLLLRQHFVSDVEVQRRIRCVKMRGTRHETAYLTLIVDEGRMKATKALAV